MGAEIVWPAPFTAAFRHLIQSLQAAHARHVRLDWRPRERIGKSESYLNRAHK